MERLEKKIEINPSVDKSAEKPAETSAEVVPQQGEELPVISASAPAPSVSPQDEELVIIKSVLSENIAEVYYRLPSEKRQDFRRKGEEAAKKIRLLLSQAKIKVHEILRIILNWLMLLPGINKYFLEQEAKIKTDKILQMKKEGQVIEK